MHVLLIRPGVCGHRVLDALPPLAIGILAALTPDGTRVTFVDDALGERYDGPRPDLVAISTHTFSALRAYELADTFVRDGVPVVLGGYHPTLMSAEAQQHATSVVVGDAEGVWERIVQDAKADRLQPLYVGDPSCALVNMRINRTIFRNKPYPPIELAWYTRGCRFSCDFCAIKAFYPNVRVRTLHEFEAELDTLDHRRILFVVDDNIYATPRSFRELLAVLRRSGMRWVCQISIDVARDEALVEEMARAGCMMVTIGFESLNVNTLRQIGKGWNQVAGSYRDVVARFHAHGIAVYGTFVFGYDDDTLSTIEEAYEFAMQAKLEIANFNPLTPMPGSRLYERLEQEGRLLYPRWWNDTRYRYGDPIFTPKRMDADAFAEKCYWAKRKFYEWNAIAKRLLGTDAPFNWFRLKAATAANIVSHREIARKQHRRLGG